METETLGAASWADIGELTAKLQHELRHCQTVEQAAQKSTEIIATGFDRSVALARAYLTMTYDELPKENRAFVDAVVRSRGLPALQPSSMVLSLLGTYGADPLWKNRRNSTEHLCIPLINAAFVDSIPMVSRLLTEIGVDIQWFDHSDTKLTRRLLGAGNNGVFYVQNAKTATDSRGRRIIPAQDFVETHRIRTVFGMGGSYPVGAILAFIVFSREEMTRVQVERCATIVSGIKSRTSRLVSSGQLFG